MKNVDLEKFIQGLSQELYSMAFVLIPDDLQASQLMIDAVSAFLIQRASLIEKWESEAQGSEDQYKATCKAFLLRTIYELSKKRYGQLKMSFKEVEDNSGFFSLDIDEKAALYLKDRLAFSLEMCEFIMAKSRMEILAHLYSARVKMTETSNTVMTLDQVVQHQGH